MKNSRDDRGSGWKYAVLLCVVGEGHDHTKCVDFTGNLQTNSLVFIEKGQAMTDMLIKLKHKGGHMSAAISFFYKI